MPALKETWDTWDIQFFLRNPTDFPRLDAQGFRMALVTDPSQPFIEKLVKLVPTLRRFFENIQKQQLFICVIRTTGETTQEAIFKAHRLIEHYIDSLAVAGFCIPGLAPAVVVRRGDDPDACVTQFDREKWMEGNPLTTTERTSWKSRSEAIMQHMIPILAQLIEQPADSHTELAWRAIHSAKLFRRGIESKRFGVEFLCKFVALENLVIGGESANKGQKLRARLAALVGNTVPNSESLIEELWKRRHQLVHEARVEFIEDDPKGFPVHVHMEILNWLFQVTFVFLSNYFETVSSSSDLWELAKEYRIPDQVRDARPKGIARFPASKWTERSGMVWKGAGKLIDDLWAAPLIAEPASKD